MLSPNATRFAALKSKLFAATLALGTLLFAQSAAAYSCAVIPTLTDNGTSVIVSASGLLPNTKVTVSGSCITPVTVPTSSTGTLEVVVPFDGNRNCTISIDSEGQCFASLVPTPSTTPPTSTSTTTATTQPEPAPTTTTTTVPVPATVEGTLPRTGLSITGKAVGFAVAIIVLGAILQALFLWNRRP